MSKTLTLIEPYKPEHPIFTFPKGDQAQAFFERYGADGWNKLMADRNERIRLEEQDPMRYGVELAPWALADYVAGFISREEYVKNDKVPQEWKAKSFLDEFKMPADLLLILGGNRSSKTQYVLKRTVKDLVANDCQDIWVFHENTKMSVRYHQPIVYQHLPQEWKLLGKGSVGYVSYKVKTGFSDMSFVGANASTCTFRTYEEKKESIEGGNLGNPEKKRSIGFVADELVPQDWVDTLRGRIVTNSAVGIVCFTPVNGYSQTVGWFRMGARTVLEREVHELSKPRMLPLVEVKSYRVEGGKTLKMAVVYFHSQFNPYGNFQALRTLYAQESDEQKAIRFYGFCENERQALFPRLRRKIHSFKLENLPKDGTRYMYCDPCGVKRNWFMLWCLVDPFGRKWIYREWPCPKISVKGVGYPEPWAIEGQTEQYKFGGIPAGGAKSFGFGIADYKEVIAKLEGWRDAADPSKPIEEWDEFAGSKEKIYWRKIDSRFAAVAHYSGANETTLLEECGEMGLYFEPASGKAVDEGLQLINSLLSYKSESWHTPEDGPQLFICEDCLNLWFALANYTTEGGQKEATKDPIDVLRYCVMDCPPYIEAEPERSAPSRWDKNRFYMGNQTGNRL